MAQPKKPLKKPTNPKLIEITPELKAKLERKKAAARINIGYEITQEHLDIAEFGEYYGWPGVKAVLDNDIDTSTYTWLLEASRRNRVRRQYEDANVTYLASLAVKTDKPEKFFEKFMKQYKANMKADL